MIEEARQLCGKPFNDRSGDRRLCGRRQRLRRGLQQAAAFAAGRTLLSSVTLAAGKELTFARLFAVKHLAEY